MKTFMMSLGTITGWMLAQIVNTISDLLYLISKPLWMRFGLWITSMQEGEK